MIKHRFSAVLICKHICQNPNLLCYAFRDCPTEPTDSGWQFLCHSNHHNEDIMVVSLEEAIALCPVINDIVDNKPVCAFTLIQIDKNTKSWEKNVTIT